MQNVPKIVRERLRVVTPTVDHPDANVLTAFSEGSLPELERATVLEHLAGCGECRDIVALALPATEAVEATIRPVSGGWLSWPTLRWGFVAAGIVAIASLGILQYQRHNRPTMMAFKASLPQTAVEEKTHPLPAASAREESANERGKIQAPPASSAPERDAVPTAPKHLARSDVPEVRNFVAGVGGGAGLGRGAFPHGPKVAFQQNGLQQNGLQQNANNFQVPAPAAAPQPAKPQPGGDLAANGPVPSASQIVEVESEAAQTSTQPQSVGGLVVQNKLPQPPPGDGYAQSNIERAKPAETALDKSAAGNKTLAPDSTANGRKLKQSIAQSPTSQPRWTINSTGGLQRSFDQGNTWQDVTVSGAPVSAGGPVGLEVAATMSRAKASDSKKDTATKKEAAPATFRAVAANGANVWAGGSGGLLYHSTDAGAHWTRVVPSSADVTLAGDIVSLEFADSQHGKVVTSTAEVWITADAGQSWQKQ